MGKMGMIAVALGSPVENIGRSALARAVRGFSGEMASGAMPLPVLGAGAEVSAAAMRAPIRLSGNNTVSEIPVSSRGSRGSRGLIDRGGYKGTGPLPEAGVKGMIQQSRAARVASGAGYRSDVGTSEISSILSSDAFMAPENVRNMAATAGPFRTGQPALSPGSSAGYSGPFRTGQPALSPGSSAGYSGPFRTGQPALSPGSSAGYSGPFRTGQPALSPGSSAGYSGPFKTGQPALSPGNPMQNMPGAKAVSSNNPKTSIVSSGADLMAGLAGELAFGAIGGGVVGGGVSYLSGGEFGQGAMVGAIAGAGLAGGYHGALKLGQAGIEGFSPKIAAATANFQDANIRRGAFLGGAMLAGGVFGGNRSHRRGFNSSRGNTINH